MEILPETTTDFEAAPIHIRQKRSLWIHLRLSARAWAFKAIIRIGIAFMRTFKVAQFALKPSYTKSYSVGARMRNDFWLPSDYKSGQTLPLYIDIHGGGFVIGDPRQDAEFCRYLAEEQGICVVSVNYPKAPWHPFPCASEELVKVIQSVLQDESLPVDKGKVAIGGFSAGGNLALSVSLRDELQGKIQGLLLWYPVTDFSGQYKGQFQTDTDGSHGALSKATTDMFDHAYVSEGQDLRDPHLSPVYADRRRLPSKIFFICAEYDSLCHEAEKTAELYAAKEDTQERIGNKNDWKIGGIRWKKVLGVAHGFNLINWGSGNKRRHQAVIKEVYSEAAEWLKSEAYASLRTQRNKEQRQTGANGNIK
jgi:acetyl esterase/lipase